MEKELTNRQKQAAQTKQRIRKCAFDLIAHNDYDQITIADICKASEVSVGTFYHYFASKEDMMLQGHTWFDDYLQQNMPPPENAEPIAALREVIRGMLTGAEKIGPKLEAQMLRMLLCVNGQYVVDPDRFLNIYAKQLIAKAIQNGDIHASHDMEETSALILRHMRGMLFDWSIREGAYPLVEKGIEDFNYLINTMKQPREPLMNAAR